MCREFENSLLYVQGFTFFIILPLKQRPVFSAEVDSCTTASDFFGKLRGNCHATGITSIPQNLNASIEVLDISFNTISTLDKDDLKNYPQLWGLVMRNLPVTSFPEGFFQYTTSIKMLNISETHISNVKEIPASVETLNATFSTYETVDFSHLVNLKQLFMSHSDALKTIPNISEAAPLNVLDLRFCNLSEAAYPQLAPLCKLRYFGLNSTELSKEKYLTQCCGLRKWGFSWNLTGFKSQGCTGNATHPFCYSLGLKFDQHSINVYRNCIQRSHIFQTLFLIIFFTICTSAVIATSTGCFFYYRYKSLHPKIEDISTSTELEVELESDGNSIE